MKHLALLLSLAACFTAAPSLAEDRRLIPVPLSPQQVHDEQRPSPMIGKGEASLFTGEFGLSSHSCGSTR